MKKKVQKEFICEQDRLMAAFAKVNLREAVDPIYKGKIVGDEELYNKVQQLLDCQDMEHAHQFLLDIDFEDVQPETKQKVDDLYQLAVSQGYLDNEDNDEETDIDETMEDTEQPQVSDNSGGFENEVPNPEEAAAKNSIGMNAPTLNSSAFTLFYSAMKNGEIKSGECYSNATTLENAKLDAIQKLQKLGFTAIDIIAAEETDLNAKGCDSCQPEEFGAPLNDVEDENETSSSSQFMSSNDDEEDNESEEEEYSEEESEESEDEDSVVKEAKEADNKDDDSTADEESSNEESEKEEETNDEELSRSEKIDLFKRYLEEFKGLLQKMKAETYADMALADRAKFYDEMSKIWKGKPDPSAFMTDDNVKQIEHMKIKLTK